MQLSTVAAVTAEALSCTKMKLSDLPKCETLMKKFYTHMLASATSAHRRVYWFHSYRLFPPPFFLCVLVYNSSEYQTTTSLGQISVVQASSQG